MHKTKITANTVRIRTKLKQKKRLHQNQNTNTNKKTIQTESPVKHGVCQIIN